MQTSPHGLQAIVWPACVIHSNYRNSRFVFAHRFVSLKGGSLPSKTISVNSGLPSWRQKYKSAVFVPLCSHLKLNTVEMQPREKEARFQELTRLIQACFKKAPGVQRGRKRANLTPIGPAVPKLAPALRKALKAAREIINRGWRYAFLPFNFLFIYLYMHIYLSFFSFF